MNIKIKRRKWCWIGHTTTIRKDKSNITRQTLNWNPQVTSWREERKT
jgi:hypothetical protein